MSDRAFQSNLSEWIIFTKVTIQLRLKKLALELKSLLHMLKVYIAMLSIESKTNTFIPVLIACFSPLSILGKFNPIHTDCMNVVLTKLCKIKNLGEFLAHLPYFEHLLIWWPRTGKSTGFWGFSSCHDDIWKQNGEVYCKSYKIGWTPIKIHPSKARLFIHLRLIGLSC